MLKKEVDGTGWPLPPSLSDICTLADKHYGNNDGVTHPEEAAKLYWRVTTATWERR